MKTPSRFLKTISLLLLAAPGVLWSHPAQGQEINLCQPPAPGEYLLLVDGQTSEQQNRLEQVLPAGASIVVCQYQGQTLIRVGTFEDEALALSWAEYLTTVEGFPTTVATPAEETNQSENTSTSAPQPSSTENFPQPTNTSQNDSNSSESASNDSNSSRSFAPAVLGDGYAVLVRYFNQPEIASAVQASLNAPIGLAVYEQQPYLLVAYSTNADVAGQVLQGLSERQFSAFLVNSRQVVVLTPSVTLIPIP